MLLALRRPDNFKGYLEVGINDLRSEAVKKVKK
jgi:hypothetical protein